MTKLTDGLLTLNQFAERIGSTYYTVYGWIKKHGLPCIQIGAKLYVRESDYNEWLASRVVVQVKPKRKAEEALEMIKDMPKSSGRVDRIAAKCVRVY